MNLSLYKRMVGDVVVLDVRGRIAFGDECDSLRREVKSLIAAKPISIVLNLAQVSYVDSGGIGTLVSLFTSAHTAGCDLKLASPTERVRHVLDITKLLPILSVFPTEDRAVASVQRRASA